MEKSFNNEDKGILSSSERRLLVAVLQKAISDYLIGEGEVRRDAENWIFSDKYEASLPFYLVCESLGLDHGALRQSIKKLASKPKKKSNLQELLN